MTSKNVQIPLDLFFALCRHHIGGTDLSDQIRPQLEAKLEAIVRQDLYRQYKDPTLPADQREAARQAYIAHKGIPDDFRW